MSTSTHTQTVITPRQQLIFWIVVILLVCGFFWLFSDMLLPFVLGAGIAYLLNPLVNKLATYKISRTVAALLILTLFFVIMGAVFALILPIAYRELVDFADALPGYIQNIQGMLAPYSQWLIERTDTANQQDLQKALQNHIGSALNLGGDVLAKLTSGGQALLSFIMVVIITPIVAFMMMRQWPQMTGAIDNLLPRRSYDTVKDLMGRIDHKIAGFVRGQLSVVAVLSVGFILALSLAGLNFAILIGLIAGILSIIPLIGSSIGLILSVTVAYFQAGTWDYVALIAAIFITGQILETNVITPRLLGQSVDMHPLWILFALLAGSSLAGIVGMLLAVPVAAILSVLLGYALMRYKDSIYYKEPGKTEKTSPSSKETTS